MDEELDIVRFHIVLPIVSDTMPDQIFVKNQRDGMIFIATVISDVEYKWNVTDEHDIKYKIYTMSMIKDNDTGDIVLICYLPTYIISKVGIHNSYWCSYFPFLELKCNFVTYGNSSKSMGVFDHNVIDFTPKILINKPEKIKIFIYRPTFTELQKEINCLCYIEY